MRDAHAAGLLVMPWTFRAENSFLPTDLRVGDRRDVHDGALSRSQVGAPR